MQSILKKAATYIQQPVHIAPLAVFRILFGGVMLASILRFMWNGWIEELYIKPVYHFTYYGFGWVQPLNELGMYAIFILIAVTALLVMLGLFYRISITLFFLSFTYVELIDKSTYLNHYYFVSIISFLLILVPANRYFSLDVWRKPMLRVTHVPRWTIGILQWQLALVYFYAGVAKLNYDWLIEAMPLKIWLPAHSNLPLIGSFFDKIWVIYLFSWFGAFYDLTIFIFLSIRSTRVIAYCTVVIFHLMTAWLFQIGMFPYIMMLATLIFFPENFNKRIIDWLTRIFHFTPKAGISEKKQVFSFPAISWQKLVLAVLAVHFFVQLVFPWRFLLYPGKLFWTEQGYRFSWRVMLMEKSGLITFYIKDTDTGKEWEVINSEYLTPNQEKMMSTQPDMILQFAHYIKEKCREKGIQNPEIRAEGYVTLNGRGSRPFINKNINLLSQQESFSPKTWIMPFHE